MHPVLKVILLVVLPLAWGLGVEFVFEWVRRIRARRKSRGQAAQ